MKRTTIMLPDDLDARLRFEARRRGAAVAELIREALEARYGAPAGPRHLSFVALGRGRPGTPPDAAARYEELMVEDLAADRAERSGRRSGGR